MSRNCEIAPLPDALIAQKLATATAQIERGAADAACIVEAWELLAMASEIAERRARDVAAAGRGKTGATT
jgi:hypothetical protein